MRGMAWGTMRPSPTRECTSLAIDIDRLSEEQLIDLNHRIVARLKLIQQLRAHTDMLDFRIGERVTFEPDDRPPVTGIIAKYNRKTVSIVTEDGSRWNVSPGFLSRAAQASLPRGTNVYEMPLRPNTQRRPDPNSRSPKR
jgi:hypothetical protein